MNDLRRVRFVIILWDECLSATRGRGLRSPCLDGEKPFEQQKSCRRVFVVPTPPPFSKAEYEERRLSLSGVLVPL